MTVPARPLVAEPAVTLGVVRLARALHALGKHVVGNIAPGAAGLYEFHALGILFESFAAK